MSSEFKDIEHLFSDKLHNYEVTPPASVWNNIQQKKKKGIFFYFRGYLKVAVILLFLTTVIGGIRWIKTIKNTDSPIVDIHENKKISKSEDIQASKDAQNYEMGSESDNHSKNTGIISSPTSENQHLINKDHSKKSYVIKKTSKIFKTQTDKTYVPSLFEQVDLVSKNDAKLKYLIYPSLMQFVYNNKRVGKNLNVKKEKEKDDIILNSKYSMEILGGPSYASKRLSGQDYLLRKESEIATMSIQTGLKLNYHLNPKFNIQSGVIIENRNEKIKFSHSEIQQKLIQTPKQVTVYHPVLPPKTITIIDSTYTDEVKEHNFNTTNKYTTISVPLVLGYRFALGKAIYRFSAGTLVNVHTFNSASVLVREGSEITLVPYKENSKVKASVYSAIALQLPLSPTCNFITELSYYNNLKNRLSSETSVQQINYGFNLSIGASFDLKK